MSLIRLIDLLQGEEGYLAGFSEEDDFSMRLRDLGMNDGVVLRVIKYAPMGDPVQVRLRGFDLSIQRSVAKKILVEKKVGAKVETNGI